MCHHTCQGKLLQCDFCHRASLSVMQMAQSAPSASGLVLSISLSLSSGGQGPSCSIQRCSAAIFTGLAHQRGAGTSRCEESTAPGVSSHLMSYLQNGELRAHRVQVARPLWGVGETLRGNPHCRVSPWTHAFPVIPQLPFPIVLALEAPGRACLVPRDLVWPWPGSCSPDVPTAKSSSSQAGASGLGLRELWGKTLGSGCPHPCL